MAGRCDKSCWVSDFKTVLNKKKYFHNFIISLKVFKVFKNVLKFLQSSINICFKFQTLKLVLEF